jgi:DNA-binding LytR/AlgR family response regulator
LLDTHPDIALLFTDIVMPDVNGAGLAEEARRRRPELKVLFTTGYTRNAVVHNGVLDPGVELIGKPFTIEDLAAKVREVLDAPPCLTLRYGSPSCATRHIVPLASSETSSAPSCATVTPTGRPQTSSSLTMKPVRKSS